jgi:hypothetical protein
VTRGQHHRSTHASAIRLSVASQPDTRKSTHHDSPHDTLPLHSALCTLHPDLSRSESQCRPKHKESPARFACARPARQSEGSEPNEGRACCGAALSRRRCRLGLFFQSAALMWLRRLGLLRTLRAHPSFRVWRHGHGALIAQQISWSPLSRQVLGVRDQRSSTYLAVSTGRDHISARQHGFLGNRATGETVQSAARQLGKRTRQHHIADFRKVRHSCSWLEANAE